MSDSGMKNIKILLLICESRKTAFLRKLNSVVFCEEYLYWRSDRIFGQIEQMFAPVSDCSIRFDVW